MLLSVDDDRIRDVAGATPVPTLAANGEDEGDLHKITVDPSPLLQPVCRAWRLPIDSLANIATLTSASSLLSQLTAGCRAQ